MKNQAQHTPAVMLPVGPRLRLHPLYAALFILGLSGQDVWARDYFDPAFLSNGDGGAPVDLSQFESATGTPEGSYLVDIYLNGESVTTRQLPFVKDKQGKVVPSLTPAMLADMGVAVERVPALKSLPKNAPVGDLAALIPSAKTDFNLPQLRLNISVPQADMNNRIGGYVDPALWDQGIPAMLFNYNLNGSKNWQDGNGYGADSQSQSLFAGMTGGVNLGAWRLRSSMNYSSSRMRAGSYSSEMSSTRWQNTYLQRDVQPLRGELTLGESSTGSDVFDSIPFRGAQLVSNDNMIPSSQRGFSPVITGIASSNAQVAVSQNGFTIYQTTVPPGPFRLTDIYQASGGGDLVITVTEADGTRHISRQAYSTLPVMKRPGGSSYEVTVGRFHNGGYTDGARSPLFALGALTYGLPHYVTVYGGALGANDYQAIALGTGVSLGLWGALSVDTTLASATLPGNEGTSRGSSYRARYSKSMLSTGTSVDLTAYRYSTRDYYSFSDANTFGYRLHDGWAPWIGERRRSSWQTNLSQSLGSYGSLSLRGSRDDYWGTGRVVNGLSAGFSSSVKGVSYSVNYSIDHTSKGDGNWPTNRQVSFNMSVPFSLFTPSGWANTVSATYSVSQDNRGRTSQQTGLSGSMLDGQASWNASQSWDNQGGGRSGNLGVGYQGSDGNLSLGYGYSQGSRNVNATASGGVLVHQHGVTLSQYLGDAVALVSAPGASDVRITTGNVSTDWRGYAVAPYMQSYQRNVVSMDPTTLPDGVDIINNSTTVYPTKGAVVEAKFKTRVGRQALMTLMHAGKPVPFGAMASLMGDKNLEASIVGDGGMTYLSGMPQAGTLKVQWGRASDQQCTVRFNLGPQAPASKGAGASISQLTQVCR